MDKCNRVVLIVGMFIVVVAHMHAAPFLNLPHKIVQPNGQEIQCFVSGDEFFHRIHDEKGFTIVQNSNDGYYYYAELKSDELVPTNCKVGDCNPDGNNILPNLVIPAKTYSQLKSAQLGSGIQKAYAGNSFSNIVLFVSFTNTSEFPTTRAVYDDALNTGSSSVNRYYNEVSYGNLQLNSFLFPQCESNTNISIVVPYEKGYLSPYNAATNPGGYITDSGAREEEVVAKAAELAAQHIPSTVNVDANNDGYVDNVVLIFRGENDGWGQVYWAHQFWLNTAITINNKRVGSYTFLPETQFNAVTVCHELFHCIGAPDLYHYTGNGITPVGPWDIMDSGSSHMSGYMKWKYSGQKWINSIPEITKPGKYKLLPLVNSPQSVYKIASPYTSSEFFIVEFRKKAGPFEGSIPGSGLVVYRINQSARGNRSGPPDEVYTFRPGGSFWSNGNAWQAHLSAEAGRSFFNSLSDPRCILSDGMDGGIKIDDITIHPGDSITFNVDFEPAHERSGWKILYCISEENDTKASYAIDGNPATIWHTQWRNYPIRFPHELQIDMGKEISFRTLMYTPRRDMSTGRIGKFSVYASSNYQFWDEKKIAEGEFKNSVDKQSISFPMVKARYLRLLTHSEVYGNSYSSIAELEVSNQLPLVPKTNWTLEASSSFHPNGYEATLAFDGKGTTFWHTKYSPVADPYPHFITVDMGNAYSIEAFSYLPRQDNNPNGNVKSWVLETSLNKANWSKVASGDFPNHSGEKKVYFPIHVARYFRFTALSEVASKSFAAAAEVSFFGVATTDIEPPIAPANIKGTPTSSDKYMLVWDSATDNSGKVYYEVYKDDFLLSVTDLTNIWITSKSVPIAYPFNVKIKAFDGAGNSSSFVSYVATAPTVNLPDYSLDDIRIFLSDGVLTVSALGDQNCFLQLYDTSGRVIWQGNVHDKQNIEIGRTDRLIIAKFISNGNTKTEKIIQTR